MANIYLILSLIIGIPLIIYILLYILYLIANRDGDEEQTGFLGALLGCSRKVKEVFNWRDC